MNKQEAEQAGARCARNNAKTATIAPPETDLPAALDMLERAMGLLPELVKQLKQSCLIPPKFGVPCECVPCQARKLLTEWEAQ